MNDFAVLLRGAVEVRSSTRSRLGRVVEAHGVSGQRLEAWLEGDEEPGASDGPAVAALEDALEVPSGFLASRLPAERERLRAAGLYDQSSVPADDPREPHEAAVSQLGMSYADFVWECVHDRIRIDEHHAEAEHEVRLLLTATRDGVEAYPVWIHTSDSDSYPVVTAVSGTRVGRVLEFRENACVAVQMLLPRPLAAGETVSVEHRQSFLGVSTPRDRLTRGVGTPSREVVMEVQFDPRALPSRVMSEVTVAGERLQTELEPRSTVQLHVHDSPPGEFEIWWVP
ncbi:MAG: hypothetical protein Q4G43_12695 [Mobilicoccus sp.]|nr:hypothetical protein [Mobilicoccus sp.]